MKKKFFALLISISFLFIISEAHAYKVNIDPVKDTGYPGDKLKYQVVFENDKSYEDTVKLNIFNVYNWDPHAGKWQVQLEPGEEEKFNLTLTLPDDARADILTLFLHTWSVKTEETTKQPIMIRIKSEAGKPEKKFFLRSVDWAKKIDPRKSYETKVNVESRSKKITEMKVRYYVIKRGKEILVEAKESKLLPMSNTSVSFDTRLASKMEPSIVTQKVSFFVNQSLVKRKTSDLEVKGYSDIIMDSEKSSSLTGKEVVFTITNNGTAPTEKQIKEEVSFFEKFLLSTEEGKVEGKEIKFDFEVGAGETKKVSYQVTYIPILVAPFILLVLGYGVYYLTRKASLEKNLLEKKTKDRFEAKMEIMFRAKSDLHDVQIVETLPPFVGQVGQFGTLEPEVRQKEEAKKLVWTLGDVSKNEEIILSYKAKSEMGIVGEAVFPPTKATFDYKDKEGETYSKKLKISSRPKVEELEEQG